MGHLGPEELRRVKRGLVDHHGHALGLHALHDALDGARAEVVGVGLHRQAVDVRDQLRLAGILEINRIVYGLLSTSDSSCAVIPMDAILGKAQQLQVDKQACR